MAELPTIDEQTLQLNDAPRLVWIRAQDAVRLLWKDNPKRHDVGGVIESIERYGFQEPAKFDVQLPNVGGGQGAIKAGNGRIEAVAAMENDDRYTLPRGAAKDENGAWCVPLLIGTDARSEEMAAAYGIDANNLTLAGGDFTAFEYLRLWDEKAYILLAGRLAEADELPVTIDGDIADLLLGLGKEGDSPFSHFDDIDETEQVVFSLGDYRGHVSGTVYKSFVAAYQRAYDRIDGLLDDVFKEWLNV